MTDRRTFSVLAILAVFIATGAVAGYLFASSPRGPALPWSLRGIGGANSSAAAMDVADPNVVRVHIEQWPVEFDNGDDSWLTKSVDEGGDTVTVTLRVSDNYRQRTEGQATIGWFDTGGWVTIELSQPLGDRALFDGSTSPATRR